MLAFLNAGASGSYGTVIEPCAYPQKFPLPQDYFYQARGFSLAECYYMSLANPYQGLIVGEPLAAPFARPPVGAWINLPANSVLSGITNLTLQCTASTSNRPIQQVDLFLDGTWLQTLTNIPPAAGNQLYVTINGYPTNYTRSQPTPRLNRLRPDWPTFSISPPTPGIPRCKPLPGATALCCKAPTSIRRGRKSR